MPTNEGVNVNLNCDVIGDNESHWLELFQAIPENAPHSIGGRKCNAKRT